MKKKIFLTMIAGTVLVLSGCTTTIGNLKTDDEKATVRTAGFGYIYVVINVDSKPLLRPAAVAFTIKNDNTKEFMDLCARIEEKNISKPYLFKLPVGQYTITKVAKGGYDRMAGTIDGLSPYRFVNCRVGVSENEIEYLGAMNFTSKNGDRSQRIRNAQKDKNLLNSEFKGFEDLLFIDISGSGDL